MTCVPLHMFATSRCVKANVESLCVHLLFQSLCGVMIKLKVNYFRCRVLPLAEHPSTRRAKRSTACWMSTPWSHPLPESTGRRGTDPETDCAGDVASVTKHTYVQSIQ